MLKCVETTQLRPNKAQRSHDNEASPVGGFMNEGASEVGRNERRLRTGRMGRSATVPARKAQAHQGTHHQRGRGGGWRGRRDARAVDPQEDVIRGIHGNEENSP